MQNKTKLIFIIIIAVIIILFTYNIYVPYTIQQFSAVNLKNIRKIKKNVDENNFSFVVLGNIKNSISVFDKKILKKLQANKPDFIISTGNNVVDSGEGKYRVLNRTLQRMEIPFVTGVGENEIKDEGYKNFYKYFGPFYFSFVLKNSYFIFLDTTGHSSDIWQHQWLEKELKASQKYNQCFVFMNEPPIKVKANYLLDDKKKYMHNPEERKYYQDIFSRYQVTSVFSSDLEIYHQEKIKGVNYIISGGAGGELIVETPDSFYHYIEVKVNSGSVKYNLRRLKGNPGLFAKLLVNIWVALQSFLYTNYVNLIIIALILFMGGFLFYRELNREVDYYRSFRTSKEVNEQKKLTIAMFTNNYLPAIGGVPISIERLARGFRELGHEVYIFAPRYLETDNEDEHHIIRCKVLHYFQNEGMDMPITNIFSRDIEKNFAELDVDLVHCHHPFWLSSKGLFLGRKFEIPVVFTYHTRLEKYSHYLPGFLFIKKLFENRISHLIIKRFANKCDAVFAPTDSTREYLRNIGVRKHIKVLPTGVDLNNYDYDNQELISLQERYTDTGEFLLITVSRLSKEKNLYFLLDGLAIIKEKTDKKFTCLVVGDGSEKENLEAYIQKKSLKDYVKLIGAVNFREINKYYLVADIFVFASTSETQGMVLLEAMAGNTPVVAVRSSGTDDIIKNGFNGYKTIEDVDKWSEKVIKLMDDKELLAESAENAEEMAKRYSLKNVALEAEKVYKKLID